MLEVIRVEAPIDLGDFHKSLEGQIIQMWVNISRSHIRTYSEVFRNWAEAVNKKDLTKLRSVEPQLAEWWAKCWDQKPKQALEFYHEAPPDLWDWLVSQSFDKVDEYRKKTAGPKANSINGKEDTQQQLPKL